ncbi:MAG: type II toxin-antitoxin system ParD family antitoxin [Candidatus Omnitrophica bacterium]|nr:type II toxin-antitoxin system ParD family antitoxin [Candidatus Omnitrophota bacterium]
MATLNISIPVNLREWINSRVETGDYTSVSDYMRELVRLDQRRQMTLEDKLLDGLNSGPAAEVNEAFWQNLKTGIRKKAGKA